MKTKDSGHAKIFLFVKVLFQILKKDVNWKNNKQINKYNNKQQHFVVIIIQNH